jgi:peptidoglycan/LPS O-acetylase OafA/YrhL
MKEIVVMEKRNVNLDLLRFLGVLIIMIAHANPSSLFSQLRNFGTPLLIVGSSLTYAFIYKNRAIDLIPFYKKRLKRLTIPAWIFLIFFFAFFYVATLFFERDYPFSNATILHTFLFYEGIGFVWILKVYMILALITPYALNFSKSRIKNNIYFGLIFLIYVMYELVNYFLSDYIPYESRKFVANTILLIFPYTALYLYGLRLDQIKTKYIISVTIVSLVVFVAMAMQKYINTGEFVATQYYKYPPTLYYLSYAFFWVNLIYLAISRYPIINFSKYRKVVVWLSSNSLWIYLWHILAYYLWENLFNDYDLFGIFFIKFTFLFSFGIILTTIQLKLVNRILPTENKYLMAIIPYFK